MNIAKKAIKQFKKDISELLNIDIDFLKKYSNELDCFDICDLSIEIKKNKSILRRIKKAGY